MKITFFLLVLIQSQGLKNNEVKVFKDLGKVNRSYEITIESFWSFKEYDIDSISIRNEQKIKQIQGILKKCEKVKKKRTPFFNPKFAIVGFFYGKIDTLYLDSEYKSGYLVKRKILIQDKNEKLKSLFKKNNQVFFD